jgi:RecA/RadA recombinase
MKILSRTPLDALLDGGLQTGVVTHVHGSAGSGKTTFALHASVSTAQLEHDVLYFDTEQTFPTSRLVQVSGYEGSDILFQRITVVQPLSFQRQADLFSQLAESGGEPWKLHNLALVVVDTIASNYRLEIAKRPQGRVFKELVEKQMPALLRAARKFDITVLILNQVTSNLSSAQVRPVGGDAVSRYSKYQVELEIEEIEPGTRSATIEKAPKNNAGKKVRYILTSTGMTEPATAPQPLSLPYKEPFSHV